MSTKTTKIAAITMVRRLEFPAAWSCLSTVDPQLGQDVHHFLLLNDEDDHDLVATLSDRPHTTVLTPGKNLGVAVGRNSLIKAAIEWGADILISLDDDLLVPSDYINRIRTRIADLEAAGEKVGIVAPAVMDFHAIAERIMTTERIADAEQGRLTDFWDTGTLRQRIAQAWEGDLPVDTLYHSGIRNWRFHYLESYRSRPARLRSLYLNVRGINDPKVGINEMRLDPTVRQAILTGDGSPIEIDTAAGGACAYTTDLLREIGGLDEAFSPFGYEDSDFAIRSLSAGFRNYTLTTEILLHDLDSRQKKRSPAILLHSQGRARALIARKHVPASERARALTEIAALAPLQAVDLIGATDGRFPSVAGGIIGSTIAYLAGFIEGLFTVPSEPDVASSERTHVYPSVPHRMERRTTVRHHSWSGTPVDGLPLQIPFDVNVSYNWDAENGHFALHHLDADAPGLIRVKLTAEIDQVGRRDTLGNPDPLECRVRYVRIEIEDWEFLHRFQTTAAWFRKERSAGYLAPLLRSPSSRIAKTIKQTLSLRRTPALLAIEIDPPDPISVAELFDLTPGINLERRLGMSVMVNESARY